MSNLEPHELSPLLPHRHTDMQAHTDTYTCTHIDTHAHTDTHMYIHTHRDTDRHRHTHAEFLIFVTPQHNVVNYKIHD